MGEVQGTAEIVPDIRYSVGQLVAVRNDLNREYEQGHVPMTNSSQSNILSSGGRVVGYRSSTGRPELYMITRRANPDDVRASLLPKLRPVMTDEEYKELMRQLESGEETVDFDNADSRFRFDYSPHRDTASVEFYVALNPAALGVQTSTFRTIFDDFRSDADTPVDFDDWFKKSVADDLEISSGVLSRTKEIKQFRHIVTTALGRNPFYSDIARQLTSAQTETRGLAQVLEAVNSISQDNLTNYLGSTSNWELARLFGVATFLTQRGDAQIDDPIFQGFDQMFKPSDMLKEEFWQKDFPRIVDFLIKNKKIFLVHNMHGIKNLQHNQEHGTGRSYDRIQGDITETYATTDPAPTITYSIVGTDSLHYQRGARMGGKGDFQARMDIIALASRTIFFPCDTGDPDARIVNENAETRAKHVFNVVGATELFLIRHLGLFLTDSLPEAERDNDVPQVGNATFIEGNTFGHIPMTPEYIQMLEQPDTTGVLK